MSKSADIKRYFQMPNYQYIEQIKQQGFAHLTSVVPLTTIEKIKGYLEDELSTLNTLCQSKYHCSLYEMEDVAQSFQGQLDKINHEDRFLFSGVFPTKVRLTDTVESIFSSPALINELQLIFNSNSIFAHLPAMARYILPNSQTSAVPPHIDAQYNQHLSNFLTVWIPLVSINEQCGGVDFYQFTNSSFENHKTNFNRQLNHKESNYWHDSIPVENMTKVSPHIDIGDVLVFPPDTVHGSASNLSNHVRFSLDIRVFSENGSSTKHYINMKTGERFSPKETT